MLEARMRIVLAFDKFKDALTAGAYLIDVRETSEYAEGHIEGAVNIPLRTLTQNLAMIPTDRQVFVYCKSGYRAGLATSRIVMPVSRSTTSVAPAIRMHR